LRFWLRGEFCFETGDDSYPSSCKSPWNSSV
jgi:hypothetical protein